MTRNPIHTAIAVALFATLALAGCKKKDEAAVTPPPVTEPAAPAPMPTEPAPPAAFSVTTVDLGSAVGADNRVTAPMTSFAKGDTIHASVATDGAAGNLTAKWTMSGMGDHVVDTQDKAVAAGPQVTEFSISKPDGWPVGKYKLEISSNGMVVQSREFDVK
ncbi:MAG TPA: hypothetical protein VHF02_00640 [Luteimonas sp.]|nr:hypothetical protein [Luteimonas sp.]